MVHVTLVNDTYQVTNKIKESPTNLIAKKKKNKSQDISQSKVNKTILSFILPPPFFLGYYEFNQLL